MGHRKDMILKHSLAGLLLGLWVAVAPAAGGGLDRDLLDAAARGEAAAVSSLLTKGARVNRQDERGLTPLMHAALRGHDEALDILLANGADVNQRDEEGDTALKHDCWNDDLFVVEALLTKGVDANAATAFNVTPLRAAAMSGHATIVELLLKHGADPTNIRGKDGRTALSYPLARQQWEIVRMLKDAGAKE